jgi:dolichol-phosphate mannosyltransferase
MATRKKTISYIFPVYNEGGNLRVLYRAIHTLLAKHPQYTYELLFINDGSRDDSLEQLVRLQQIDTRITIIDFSRNFGHQMAVTAGLDYARGDAVIIMDSDMQDPPKVSFELLKKWEEGYDVVYAQRRSRKDTAFKKATAFLFYRIIQKMADVAIPRDTGDFRLLDRRVVDEIKLYRENNRFLRGLVSYVGFRQIGVLFDRDKRYAGKTHYPLAKMIRFASDGIVSFSTKPLQLISHIGYLTAVASLFGICYALVVKFFYPHIAISGWTFTVIAIFFIGGVQMVMLGVLGGYIGRIYTEVKNRPLYTVSAVYDSATKRRVPRH